MKIVEKEGSSIYLLALVSCALLFLPDHIQSYFFLYTSQAHPNFHIGQWITGHLSHLSWHHFFGNLIGLILFQQFYGKCITGKRWIFPTLFVMLSTSITLQIVSVELLWYAGLSSTVFGLTCYCSLIDTQHDWKLNIAIITSIGLYSILQTLDGELTKGFRGIPVATYSHIAAIAFGIILGLCKNIFNATAFSKNT